MGALDRIVSASSTSRGEGGRTAIQGKDAPGAQDPNLAPGGDPREDRAGRDRQIEEATGQEHEGPRGERLPSADAPTDDARARAEGTDRGDRGDRGDRELSNENETRRAREGAPTDAQTRTPGRERATPAPVAAETRARREGAPREALRRVLDPSATQRTQPHVHPRGEAPSNDARARQSTAPEVRREQIVRERVIERTIVERLLAPAPARTEGDTRGATIPSLVRAPEPREADRATRDVPRREIAEAPRDLRDLRDQQMRAAAATARDRDHVPPKDAPKPPDVPRLVPRAPEKNVEAQAKHAEAPAPPARDAAKRDARRDAPRDDRMPPRRIETATRPASPPPARPMAGMIAPRAPKPAPAASKQPARDAAAREAPNDRQRQEARPAPRPTAPPRIQISIGRVEVRGKTAEPPLQRISAGGPRAHQIDPGLPFGPLEGGRI